MSPLEIMASLTGTSEGWGPVCMEGADIYSNGATTCWIEPDGSFAIGDAKGYAVVYIPQGVCEIVTGVAAEEQS